MSSRTTLTLLLLVSLSATTQAELPSIRFGRAQVPFSKDTKAENRPRTFVSLPASPVTITVVKE